MLETLHYMSSVQRLFEHPEKKSELDEKWGLVKVTTKGSTGKFTLENITSLYVVCGQPSWLICETQDSNLHLKIG